MKYSGIVVIGPVGSGKSSLAKKIASLSSFYHAGVGDICREKLKKCEKFRDEYSEGLSKRILIPDNVTMKITKDDILTKVRDAKYGGLALEGFPRNENQASELTNLLKHISFGEEELGCSNVAIIEVALNEKECFDRIMNDRSRKRRNDLSVEATTKALTFYKEEIKGIRENLRKIGYKIFQISSEGKADETFLQAKKVLGFKTDVAA
ncbi:MAG: adenylate kinase family enzyme [Candidatus Paceibacteria bacterium]|jgi:adenylate kinase family enzyme